MDLIAKQINFKATAMVIGDGRAAGLQNFLEQEQNHTFGKPYSLLSLEDLLKILLPGW